MKIALALLGVLAVATIVVLSWILPAAVGALGGWLVSLAFPNTTAAVLAAAGVNLKLWQIGAALGFLSGFLRTNVSAASTATATATAYSRK